MGFFQQKNFLQNISSSRKTSPVSKIGITEVSGPSLPLDPEVHSKSSMDIEKHVTIESYDAVGNEDASSFNSSQKTERNLKERHIQLIGIGGTIGTTLFVQIGQGLTKGGPASLLIAFIIWCIPIMFITSSTAEMVSYLPIASPFVRLAGRCVDEAFQVMAGWNFFLLQAIMVPFEITAANTVLHFWIDGYSPAIPIIIQLCIYLSINIFAVKFYGESEYWLAMGKVVLAVGLMFFTFIVMVGGNPQHDAFGFRNWKDPGAFNTYIDTGNWGRFLGFLACLIQAAFTMAGPEYVSMTAGEAENPRQTLPKAYKSVFYRLTIFFIIGALSVGIVCPYNDPTLLEAIKSGKPGAAASPYVVAMTRLKVQVFPHIVNALILSSAFSGGNSYVYCSSRALYGLASEGHAPKLFACCTKTGIPIFAVGVSLLFGLLAFLQLGRTASTVLNWMVSLVTVSQVINFSVLCLTYLRFYEGLKAQNIDRRTLPYRGWFQPYGAWIGLVCCLFMALISGWSVFVYWDLTTFVFAYVMIPICVLIYVGWKIWSGCKFIKAGEMDLQTGIKEIENHETRWVEPEKSKIWCIRGICKLVG